MLIISCYEPITVSQSISFPNNCWHKDSTWNFDAKITDVSQRYNIWLELFNMPNYPNANIWLFITTKTPKGAILKDTVEYFLCNKKGEWYGWQEYDYWHRKYPLKLNTTFIQKGTYNFSIEQGMRYTELKGIKHLSFNIEKIRE